MLCQILAAPLPKLSIELPASPDYPIQLAYVLLQSVPSTIVSVKSIKAEGRINEEPEPPTPRQTPQTSMHACDLRVHSRVVSLALL